MPLGSTWRIGVFSMVVVLLGATGVFGQSRRPANRENLVERTLSPEQTSPRSPSPGSGPIIPKAPFTNSEITMVFQIISDATGWSIFPSPEVSKAKVTVYANEITALDLLDRVIRVAGFVYHRDGDVITVMTYAEYEKHYEVEKKIIPLIFAEAQSVGKVVEPFLTDLGKQVVHAQTNTIVLYEVTANLTPISAIIQRLDTPATAIQIEVVTLEHAACEELAKILNQVFKPAEEAQRNRTEPSVLTQRNPSDQPVIPQRTTDVETIPQDRIGVYPVIHANQIVVVGIQKDVQKVLELIDAMDVAADSMVLEVIPLLYADAELIARTLQEVFGDQPSDNRRLTHQGRSATRPTRGADTTNPASEGLSIGLHTQVDIHAILRTNQLIVKAYPADLKRVLQLVEKLDVFVEPTTQTYHFTYVDASQVHEGLEHILNIYSGYAQSSARTVSTQGAGRASGNESGVTLVERTNSILVTGPPSTHRIMQSICESVDVPGIYEAGMIRVYRIQNANVEEIAQTVTELLVIKGQERESSESRIVDVVRTQIQAGDTDGESGLGEYVPPVDTKVSINQATNSIVVKATARQQREIDKLIQELDIRRKQVLIKAMIVELSKTNDTDLGIELDLIDSGEKAFTSFGLSTLDTLAGTRSSFGGTGATLAILEPGQVQAIVRALKSSDNVRIESAPHVLVNDNTEGIINSIAEEPTRQTHQGETTTTTSFGEYVEAGTQFTITPHISDGNYLHVEYQINLSSFGQKADASLPPARNTSEIQSSTTIPDSYTIVVGGIQTVAESTSVSKVPFLGDVPVLGAAFRNKAIRRRYITTYLFITATIMKQQDFGDLKQTSQEALDEVSMSGPAPNPESDRDDSPAPVPAESHTASLLREGGEYPEDSARP